jgi:hypothetical protein
MIAVRDNGTWRSVDPPDRAGEGHVVRVVGRHRRSRALLAHPSGAITPTQAFTPLLDPGSHDPVINGCSIVGPILETLFVRGLRIFGDTVQVRLFTTHGCPLDCTSPAVCCRSATRSVTPCCSGPTGGYSDTTAVSSAIAKRATQRRSKFRRQETVVLRESASISVTRRSTAST